jgi:hypothetical protein
MTLFLLCLISLFPLTVDVYRFDDGYAELWYEIPVAQMLSQDYYPRQDTLFHQYTYRLNVYHIEENDSATITGVKGASIAPGCQDDYFIDYIPLHLYTGTFRYDLHISSGPSVFVYRNDIHILPDTMTLGCSELVLGRKDFSGNISFHGHAFNPVLKRSYARRDTLLSFLELYGLIPDSLYYMVRYTLTDSTESRFFEKIRRTLKHDYTQIDTNSIALAGLASGQYQLTVHVEDSSSRCMVTRRQFFYVAESMLPGEISMEQRLREADDLFSSSTLRGRDTKRGQYYSESGPPNEIEKLVLAQSGTILEVWHYYREGNDVLFSDIAGDDNPRLIAVLRPGELMTALEFGSQDPNWHVKWPWLELITRLTPDYKIEDIKEDLIDAEEK